MAGPWLANVPPARIGLEASCGAHHLARRLAALGHDVRLMPAPDVRPLVKTNQHDQADAEAIGEAVQRPQMRVVPIKRAAQLDLQALHRVRDRLVTSRTGLINQIRACLLERKIAVRPGRLALAQALPEALEADGELSPTICTLLGRLRTPWQALDAEIDALDQHILIIARTPPGARLLMTIPGIGALIATTLVATALVAAIDGGQAFARGRAEAPRPNSGPSYTWLHRLEARAQPNLATVALAAKLARWSWAVLAKNQAYRPAAA